jgi:hypothetical protein
VNVSPTTLPLDICVRVTGAASFANPPLLRGRGITTGLPYGSITDYFDLDTTKVYDFEFVESGTASCAPPLRGYIGNIPYVGNPSQTLAIYQYQFTPIDAYNGALLNDVGTRVTGRSNVRFFDAAQLGPAFTDFYATPTGSAEALWFSHVPFGGGTPFHDAGAGVHAFRVTGNATQTVLAQKAGVTLSGNDALDVFLFSLTGTTYGLLRCPSTGATLVRACAP